MVRKDEIVDTAQFAAELKALAKDVVESKAKSKPLSKREIIASDDVWNAIKEMKETHRMTLDEIAEVFRAKGGMWSEMSGNTLGQLIRTAATLRGDEADPKKIRKPKATSRRTTSASMEVSTPTRNDPRSDVGDASSSPASRSEGAAAAEGKSKPDVADAKTEQNPGVGSGPTAGAAPKKKISLSALDREA
jgi:hypothetical protein